MPSIWISRCLTLLKGDAIFDKHLAPVNQDKRYEALFKQHADEFNAITKQDLEILCTISWLFSSD